MIKNLLSLEEMCASFGDINSEALSFIKDHANTISVARNKILIGAEEVCTNIYFVQKGIFRGFIKAGNQEITTWLTAEGELVSALRSFILQEHTGEQVQALETSQVVSFSKEHLDHLFLHFPSFNIIGRRIVEKYYCDAEERNYINRLNRADLKYEYFLKTRGQLLNRIPLKYIAAFLGMTLETLSRIRNKMSQKK